MKYKDIVIDCGFRVDVLVEGKVVLELKVVSLIEPIHEAQLRTYMRLSGVSRGLILNFDVLLMKDGIHGYVI